MGSLVPFIYLLTKSLFFPLFLTSLFLTLLLCLEYERWKNPGVWDYMLKKYGKIFKTPPGKLTGDTYFMISTFIILLIFKMEISIISLFFLVFGDAGSGIIGSKFGKIKIFPGKTFEGFLGGFIFNLLIGILISHFLSVSFYLILLGSLISATVEILPLKIDDNLSVGLVTATSMQILEFLTKSSV